MFFIFSLPRSGTAWLSTLLTARDSFCFHELTAEKNWQDLPQTRPERVVGAVDTGAYRNPQAVYAAFPTATYFTLYRRPQQITASAAKLGLNYDATQHTLPKHSALYYDDLSNLDCIRGLWNRVIGDGFDEQRTRQLMEMNIQRDVSKFMAARGLAA